MKKEKLKPILRDIDFLDKDTLLKVCSYNECCKKLEVNTEEHEYVRTETDEIILSENYFRECIEWNRRYSTKNDTKIT